MQRVPRASRPSWRGIALCLALLGTCASRLASAAAPAAVCVLDIRGAPGSTAIARASIACAGGPVALGIHALLGKWAPRFQGVTLGATCGKPNCLLSICGASRVVVRDSVVAGVAGLPQANVPTLLCTNDTAVVELHASELSSSLASGVWASGNSSVVINGSVVANNTLAGSGAGVAADAGATLLVTGASRITGNRAVNGSGGGLYADGNARVTVSGGSVIADNTCSSFSGAGAYAGGSATLLVTGASRITGNRAVNGSGGGLAAWDNTNVTVSGSIVANNTCSSDFSGAGLVAGGSATLLVTGGSRITGNTAVNASGGGLYAGGNARVTIEGRSWVAGNAATNASGGGLYADGSASLTVSGGSVIADNTCSSFTGAGVYAGGSATLLVTGASRITGNRAVNGSGGGLKAADSASVTISGGSVIADNTCSSFSGAGVYAGGSATLLVTGASRITGNTAVNAGGGGLYADGNARVTISGGSVVANNTCSEYGGAGAAVVGSATLLVTGGSHITGNRATRGSGGGLAAWASARVVIGTGVVFDSNAVDFNYSARDIYAEGTARLEFAAALPAAMQATGALTKCSPSVSWARGPSPANNSCALGEVVRDGRCDCCPVNMFSLDPSSTPCEPCPSHAHCSEGASIAPDAGYWHSGPHSAQIHHCPNPDACLEGGVCAPAYQGPLCGVCRPGFGTTLPLKCSPCMPPQQQLAVYACASLALVLAIAATVHCTWTDNLSPGAATLRASDLIKVLVQFLQYLVIVSSVSAPWPGFLLTLFRVASVVFAAASGQVVSLDCLLSHYLAGSPVPLAIQRQLFYLLAPLLVAAAVFCVQVLAALARRCLARCRHRGGSAGRRGGTAAAPCSSGLLQPVERAAPGRVLLRKLPVTLLVVFYYAYPTLTKASLGFFACITIDSRAGPFPQHAPLQAAHGYWAADVRQACFAGWHRGWALSVGLLSVLLLCMGVPLGLAGLLWANRARADEPRFREHFGFLYRNLRSERIAWEAVWAAQTVLLTAIAVFHFTLEPFYSVLALYLVFAVSGVLQVVCAPYALQRLHVLHASGTACLFLVTWGALVLFNVNAKRGGWQDVAVGVLLVLLCAGFVVWCVCSITAVSLLSLQGTHARLVGWCPGICAKAGLAPAPARAGTATTAAAAAGAGCSSKSPQ